MSETDEKVLCVPYSLVHSVLENGWHAEDSLEVLLRFEWKEYRYRDTTNDGEPPVEQDDRWKQLIPYIVVVNKDGQILAFNRGSKGGENRLVSKWAVGFGGHVNDKDEDWMDGVHREIYEELEDVRFLPSGDNPAAFLHGPIGFLNDDSNDVGRKHLGVVYVLRADEVTPKENPEWCWIRPEMTKASDIDFESWAVLALPMVRAWIDGGCA